MTDPNLLKLFTPINTFYLLNALVDKNQLFQVYEMAYKVHAADVVQAEIQTYLVFYIFLLDVKKAAYVINSIFYSILAAITTSLGWRWWIIVTFFGLG